MDEITREVLESLSKQHPGAAIRLTHQFLDGANGRACGIVPNNYNGTSVRIVGQ